VSIERYVPTHNCNDFTRPMPESESLGLNLHRIKISNEIIEDLVKDLCYVYKCTYVCTVGCRFSSDYVCVFIQVMFNLSFVTKRRLGVTVSH
jgi:hypothetical protein